MWHYRQVAYVPTSQSWRADSGDSARVQNEQFWVAEICGVFGQQGWELVTVFPQGSWFQLVFKRQVPKTS